MDPVVRFETVDKTYRDFWGRRRVAALRDFDLTVSSGEVVGLLGPNGSGKTTTLRLLTGLIPPDRGSVRIFSRDPREANTRRRLGYLPEGDQLLPFLTAAESLEFYARLVGLPRRERKGRVASLLDRVGMSHAADQRISTFSKGMRRRLALAQALIGSPRLLVLDEPTSGLDPLGTRDFKMLLGEQKDRGTTCLLCSHLLSEIERVCDRVVILYKGRKIREGTLSQLLEDPEWVELELRRPSEEALSELLLRARRGDAEEVRQRPRMRSLEELFVESLAQAGGRGEGDAFGSEPAPSEGDEPPASPESLDDRGRSGGEAAETGGRA